MACKAGAHIVRFNTDDWKTPGAQEELIIRHWPDGPSRRARDHKHHALADLVGKTIKSASLGHDHEDESTLWLKFTDGTTLAANGGEDLMVHGTAIPSIVAALVLQGKKEDE